CLNIIKFARTCRAAKKRGEKLFLADERTVMFCYLISQSMRMAIGLNQHYLKSKTINYASARKRYSVRLQLPFQDRKSTRLNSSHVSISYAVFCLKKKTRDKCWNASAV